MTPHSQRRQILFRQEAIRRSLERNLRARFGAELRYTARHVKAQYPRYGNAIAAHKLRVGVILEQFYLKALSRAARAVSTAAIKAGIALLETKAKTDSLGRLQSEWARRMSALKVTEISKTTEDRIQLAIANGQAEAMTDDEIADDIDRRTGGSIASTRALTIARTESHAAAQAGGFIAAQELGVVRSKEWVSAEDPRTRESHSDADGQRVAMDDPFLIGGVPLMYPGDPDGPAEEVINCRCVIAYNLDYAEKEEVA